MSREDNLEREFKFDVPESFELPDLGPAAGGTASGTASGTGSGTGSGIERLDDQRFVSTYFDTDDFSLWARRMTLRHRAEEGERGKWTLKIPERPPAGDGSEGEAASSGVARAELSWKGPIEQMPTEALDESGVDGPLRPVVSMTADRRRLRLGDWGEIDDDVVAVTSGPRAGLRFRQIELELLGPEAGPERIESVLTLLRQAGAVPGGGVKFALAAGLE